MRAPHGSKASIAGRSGTKRTKNWGSNPPGHTKPRDSKEPRGFFFAGSKAGRDARLASYRKPIGVQAAPLLTWSPPHRPPVVNLPVSAEAMRLEAGGWRLEAGGWRLEAENKSVPFFHSEDRKLDAIRSGPKSRNHRTIRSKNCSSK